MKLHDLTLTELAAGLSAKKFSSREIVDALLARIAKADGKLHAFTEVYAKEAKALADAADTARTSGFPLGPLHGLPVVYKDLCDIAGRIGTGGSKMWEKRVATETSNTVERLTAAGMVPLGKLHMVEFAFGGWGTNPLMGAPWNPWDLKTHRTPGGSSSGTGVAVAARLAPAGIGSDTGGSVRIPCAFNGLVGLKVTFGRISLHGTMLLSWTLDSIGPMARSVEDCALLLNALAAPDPRDPTTLGQPLEDFTAATKAGSIEGMRIAVPDSNQLPDFMHHDVVQAWQASARTFESLGANVEAVRLPELVLRHGAGRPASSRRRRCSRCIATGSRTRRKRSVRACAAARCWARASRPAPMPRSCAAWASAGPSSTSGCIPTMRCWRRRSRCRRSRCRTSRRRRPFRAT